MKYECEYTVTIKLENIFMPPGHSSDELNDEITQRGRDNLRKYFNGALFDPDKKIIHEDTNEFAKNLILTLGSNEGIQLGQAIVRNNVYLGKISEVNLFSSKAMVITDLNSRVPVVIPSRGVNAILKGNGLGGAQLLFLPQNAVFENNDQIYTSGSDGIIKEGLYVGKIITDNKKDIKKRKYSVDLGFKEHQLNYVSVLKVKK